MSRAVTDQAERSWAESIPRLIAAHAAGFPDAPAILAPGRPVLSYAGLHRQVESLVAALNGMGVGRGDRVAIVLPNGPEMAVAFLSVASGATCAPLNPAYRAPEFEFYLTDLGAKALLVLAGMESPSRDVAAAHGIPIIELTPGDRAGEFGLSGVAGETARGGLSGPDDVALVLHTSGTTARPKLVPLTHTNLCSSAFFLREALQLTPADRCLNVMPLFHIHGLICAILATIEARASVACTPGFEAPRFFQWMDECRPTWYTAVPTMHQAIVGRAAANGDVIARCPLRIVRSASASLPPTVMADLEGALGVPVVESYAMTEAATSITCNPLPPGERKPGSVGLPRGPEVAVMDEDGNLLPQGQVGEIVLRGPNVIGGYDSNPDANAAAFVGDWFRTGDQGVIDDDGYLTITGRIKEIINRAGEKVSPREVDEALLEHAAVGQAVAFAMPDARLGEDVAAAVVLRAGAQASERDLQEHAARRLADFKVPRRIVFLDEVPKGPTGKLQRIGLAERLGLTAEAEPEPAPHAEYVAPATQTEQALASLWRDVLGVERVGVRDNFFHLGGDSILAMRLISRVREAWGAELSILSLFAEASTIAGQAELVDSAKDRDVGPTVRLKHVQETRQAPLSYPQEGQWILHQLDPNGFSQNRVVGLRLRGELDLRALKWALNEVVRRHEALRTSFPATEDGPVQFVHDVRDIRLPVEDLSGLGPESEVAAMQFARERMEEPFDLAAVPPLRAWLLRLGEGDHILALVTHHIVCDGWSVGALQGELITLYSAYARGEPSPLPEPAVQHADFARWQRERVASGALDEQFAYWQERLAPVPPPVALPADGPRPAAPSVRGALHELTLPVELVDGLRELGRGEGATLFMSLLAGFCALVHRYTGSEDIPIGTPGAGRIRRELEDLVGFFVNTPVVRMDVCGGPTFRELVRRAKATALAAFANQDAPFLEVIRRLKLGRALSGMDMMRVVFALKNAPVPDLSAPGLEVVPWTTHAAATNVDLSAELYERDGGLLVQLQYATDLFDAETVRRMGEHFRELLAGAVADPDRAVSSLPLMGEAERHQILVEWNDTDTAFDLDRCIHEFIEDVSARAPQRAAIEFGDECLTYAELNSRANRLAHYLMGLGLSPGTNVALCVEPSLDMPVALLGILKAGCAYLPLDANCPASRLAFMVEDAAAPVLVTQQALVDRLPPTGARVVLMDTERDRILAEPDDDPNPRATPESLAYVIYTSGSTGRPKGVQIRHRSLLNEAHWFVTDFGYDETDRVLHVPPISFDMSVKSIYPALLAGACLVLLPPGDHRSSVAVVRAMRDRRITRCCLVATLLGLVVEEADFARCESLRTVFSGGEVLPAEVQRRFFQHSSADLVNTYGPTETTASCCRWRCRRDDNRATVPIGRPIPNTSFYVLDAAMQPVPVGVPGELHIGGVGVARGYLNRPALTAEKFVPDPFSNDPSARLYRTGDLVKYLPDGNLDFIGRRDFQVQLRGHRIEPGEIEAALLEHPGVQAAVLLMREDRPGDQRLVAYAVPDGQAPADGDLRSMLKAKLPDYMVPSAFVLMDRLPVTANGKVDRAALPPPSTERPDTGGEYVAPSTPLEEAICAIWSDVLGLERVGVQDKFFDLGGNSLLAARVLARLRSALGVELRLRRLFESPSVAGLAVAVLEQEALELDEESLCRLLAEAGRSAGDD